MQIVTWLQPDSALSHMQQQVPPLKAQTAEGHSTLRAAAELTVCAGGSAAMPQFDETRTETCLTPEIAILWNYQLPAEPGRLQNLVVLLPAPLHVPFGIC